MRARTRSNAWWWHADSSTKEAHDRRQARAGEIRAGADRIAARRLRAYRTVQLALRPSPWWDVRAASRRHRCRTVARGMDRGHPGCAALARARLGRGPVPPERPAGPVCGRRRTAARGRTGVRVLLHT